MRQEKPGETVEKAPSVEEYLALRARVGAAYQALWEDGQTEEAELLREVLIALRRSLGVHPDGSPLER